MGNRQSVPGCVEGVEGVELILEFIKDPPSEDAVRIIYGSWERLQRQLSGIRLPRSFATDICEFQEILRLTFDVELEDLDDSKSNLVTAAVARMSKPEKLISALSALACIPIRELDSLGVELAAKILWVLRVIVYACGGDPVNFSNATIWMKRMHMVCKVLECSSELLSDELDFSPDKVLSAFCTNESIEAVTLDSVTRLALYLVEQKLYEQAERLARIALEVCKLVFIPPPKECFPLLNLALGISLVGLNKSSGASLHCMSFSTLVEKSVLTLLTRNVDSGPIREAAVLYIMNRPEIATSNLAVINIGRSLLSLVPRLKVSSLEGLSIDDGIASINARDQITEMLVSAYALEGHFGLAHDYVLTIDDGLRRHRMLKQLVRMMNEQDFGEELCQLKWGDEEQAVVSLLWSMDEINLLYQWYCTRGDMRNAAIVQYRIASLFLKSTDFKEMYQSLLLVLNCLKMVEENSQWIIIDQRPIDLSILRSEILQARAFILLKKSTFENDRDLVFQLLRDQHLSLAIEMVLEYAQAHSDLILDFLVDSLMDASRLNEIERPWLCDIFRIFGCGEDDFPETDVLQQFIRRLDNKSAYLECAKMMLKYKLELPDWLVEDCKKVDCNAFIPLLGNNEQFDLIVGILKETRVKNDLSPSTLAYLHANT